MDEQSLEVVQSIIDKIGRLDEDVRNRVSLALRWYQRAQGYRRTETASDTDGFISLWVAFERLVPGTKAVNSINGNLAEIHNDQTFEQIGELFCLGRISDLRNKIVHEGKRPVIEGTLLRFLAAVFVDILLHILRLTNTPRTDVYEDGSVRKTVEVSQRSM